MNNKKILIIDDDPTLAELQKELFEIEWFDISCIEIANTIKEARVKILDRLNSFWIIIIDSMRPQFYYYSDIEHQWSLDFIKEVRDLWFEWKMIAASTDFDFRTKQLKHWCNFGFEQKLNIPSKIKNILWPNKYEEASSDMYN